MVILLYMKVPENQIELKKKVGQSNGKAITHIKTVGGLHLVIDSKGSVLGSGPHRAVARKIATQFDPDIQWTELSKSEHVDLRAYEHLLPEWVDVTLAFRAAQGK
jgi:hypothetical protein